MRLLLGNLHPVAAGRALPLKLATGRFAPLPRAAIPLDALPLVVSPPSLLAGNRPDTLSPVITIVASRVMTIALPAVANVAIRTAAFPRG